MKAWKISLVAAALLSGCDVPSKSQNTEQQIAAQEIAGFKILDQVNAEPGKTAIPYKKFKLDNGLTVILHQDDSDPLVHVDVTYHVGSGREDIGKSGFAHFFEHMMFQGSENVADEEHFKIITEAGGTLNGTTNTDRTNYFETVPANQLEKMLWLESDRMGYLLDAVTQEKFEVQRETVKNERGQRVDNRPYGRLNERVSAALYPEGHPYSWPVIGYMEDLNRVNVNDLKAFFLRWYGPNNATITIGGDIDEAKTLELVNKYFGTIPKGPEVKMPEKAPVTLDADRYISMEDNVHLPLLYMSYPTVHIRHEDEAPMDILAEILGGGKTSLLYKNLVKNQFAVQASVSHPCSELACTLNMFALPNPAAGKSLADLEKIIRDSMTEFETRGVLDDDLLKVKANMEASFIFGLQSVSGKVSQLASNEIFTGNPNYIEKDIARYANVTKADVMRVYKEYIKGKHAVIMSVVPKGKLDTIAHEDTYVTPERTIPELKNATADDLNVRVAKSNFDRSTMPTAGANKPVDVPEMWQVTTTNGLSVLGAQSIETPTTSMLIKIPAGHFYESKEQAGLSNLLASMFAESTTQRSAEDMSKELRKLGSNVYISENNNYINVNVNALSKNLDKTLALVNEKLMNPAFDEAEFARVKNNVLQQFNNAKKDAGYLASTAYAQILFGDSIAGVPSDGNEATVANITLADVKAFYVKHIKPKGSQLIVVSDLPQASINKSLVAFADWKGEAPKLELNLPAVELDKGTVYLVNKDNAAQSAIRIGKRGLTQDITGEFYKASLMNFALGGAFNSRINLNLREDKGYTYGARSRFWGDKNTGGYTASAEVRADATDKSIAEFVKEISTYQASGITPEELNFMRLAINQGDALKYETPRAKLGFLAQILEHDLAPTFVDTRNEIVAGISQKEINELAKKYLIINDMIMVVVGDAKTLKPKLEAMDLKVVDYSI
ncbi:M16 family metallopeptidase [Psychrosphaera haliotis]|uniref:Insulinase family protein n=1 Tax=Psychrosphaera haliotis TaxID=555083 RepID=A0A6N8F9N0_9GAMM|nr:pitrilysin family protein [Psychrosphaera haliotis]MUH73315.1 insulinase family protein [Psychrosphaera haliotis]